MALRSYPRVYFFLSALLLSSFVEGQEGAWRNIGPWSASIDALAIDHTAAPTLYAQGFSGVFQTSDRAEHWRQNSAGPGSFDPRPASFAADFHQGGVLYEAFTEGFVRRSTDGGITWADVGPGGGAFFYKIATSPTTPGTVYLTGIPNLLFKSVDGGTSWNPVTTGLGPGASIGGIVQSSRTAGTLYLLFDDSSDPVKRALRTTDAGTTWTPVDLDLPAGYSPVILAIDPNDDARLFVFATTSEALTVQVVRRSDDGGASWTSSELRSFDSSAPDLESVSFLAVDPGDPSVVFAGPFRSVDGGQTWTRYVPFGQLPAIALVFDPITTGAYAVIGGGVSRSLDHGLTWRQASRGLPSPPVSRLRVVGSSSLELFADLWRTKDGGSNWSSGGQLLPYQFSIDDVRVDPEDSETVYVTYAHDGLWKSTDGGDHFDRTFLGAGLPVSAFAIDPTSPSTLYAALSFAGVTKSTDGGETWGATSPFNGFPFSSAAVDPTDPRDVYVGIRGDGLLRSLDAGSTFQRQLWPVRVLLQVVFDPSHHGTFYLQDTSVLLRTTDGGTTWTDITPGPGVRGMVLDPLEPSVLYAGAGDTVFRSGDAGASWIPLREGLEGRTVGELAITSGGSRLYAGTDQGVFVYDIPLERVRVGGDHPPTRTIRRNP